jgi:Fe2+ or Zn2+ uptake regulation protein
VWSATTTKQPIQLKHKAQSRTEGAVLSLLADMGTGVWSVKELAEHVRSLGNTFKRDTVRDYLHILVSRKMVVKSIHGQPHKFWKS